MNDSSQTPEMRLRMGLQRPKRVLRNLSKMSRKGSNKRKAVAPVLATLLMIAVAVAMSVIIFMWSQGFLSQTSESTGSQQGSQNQAAQSSVSIEVVTFKLNSSAAGTNATANIENSKIIVRNVGAVAVTLGSLTITGISSNSGFSGSLQSSVSSGSLGSVTASDGSTWTARSDTSLTNIAKGSSVTLTLATYASRSSTDLKSGDAVTIKVTTAVGTFAQATYTVP